MSFVSYNNQIIESRSLRFYDLERFRVADACFESILYINKTFPLLKLHNERLNRSCQLLDFEPYQLNPNELLSLIKENNLSDKTVKIRLSLVRKNGQNYTPIGNQRNVLIEAIELAEIFDPIKHLGTFSKIRKPMDEFASIKSSNALLYVLAKQYAIKNDYEEVLISNQKEQWIEASSSNLFYIKNDLIYSAKNNSGCVHGVMKNYMENYFDIKYVTISDRTLEDADEIFLTNGIKLIQSVLKFKNKALVSSSTKQLIKQVKERLKV